MSESALSDTSRPGSTSYRTTLAGVPVSQLVERFGTPSYFYDAACIDRRLADLSDFDVVRYAQKACSNLSLLKRLRQQGVVIDAVTPGEIHRGLSAGYAPSGDPAPIVYTSDIFDAEALRLVTELGIHCNCGSPDMIDQLGSVAPGREITLRINPGFGHGHSQKTNTGGPQSKHGIWIEQLGDALRRADEAGLMVTGLHMHIGSGTDMEHLAQVCGSMERAAEQVGRSLKVISAGGGLPIPYRTGESLVDITEYYRLWDETRQRLQTRFGHPLRLEIEPGRYLVAEAGSLVAEIRAIKRMGQNLFYLVDAGFNDLARPILYGAYHPMSIVSRRGAPDPLELQPVVVGGPLCESGDIFTQQDGGVVAPRMLPPAQVGDWLVIELAGAYGFVMASNYNSRQRACEVLIDQGEPRLIRRRESYDDLIACERVGEFASQASSAEECCG